MENNFEELERYGVGTLVKVSVRKLILHKTVRLALCIVMVIISIIWSKFVNRYGGGVAKIWWLYDLLSLPGFALWLAAGSGLMSAVCGYGIREFPWLVVRLGVLSWLIQTSLDVLGFTSPLDFWADFGRHIGIGLLQTLPMMLVAVGIVLLVGKLLARGKRSNGQPV